MLRNRYYGHLWVPGQHPATCMCMWMFKLQFDLLVEACILGKITDLVLKLVQMVCKLLRKTESCCQRGGVYVLHI